MTTNAENKIRLQVHAQNDFFRIVKAELENVLPQLQQYIGKKIFTLEGTSKKFVVNFVKPEPVPMVGCAARSAGCYFKSQHNKLILSIKVFYNHYDGTHYEEREITVGHLQNTDTLIDTISLGAIISDYGFDRVLNADLEIENVNEYIRINRETELKLRTLRKQIGVDYDIYRNE